MKFRRLAGFANLLVAGALLLVAWALITLLASRPLFKRLFDLTPQARATVSQATKDLLAEVRKQDLTLEFHLFFQPMYSPPQDDYAKAWWDIDSTLQTLTRDLLRQYSYLGGDAVKVRDYNLDTELEASRQAVQRFSVTSPNTVVVVLDNRNKKLALRLDLGDIDLPTLQPTAGPARRSVPTLRDFRGEEALTSAIKSLLVSGKPVVYFLTGYGEANLDGSTGGDYSNLRGGLEHDGFTVRMLALKQQQTIPDDATALALLEPQLDFTEGESDLLVAWLRRGGRLFVNYGWHPLADHNPSGEHLGRRLGFELTRGLVFQKTYAADGVQRLDGNPAVANLVCIYNPNHPVTGPLGSAHRSLSLKMGREFLSGAELPKGVHLDALARTDELSWIAQSRPDPTGMPLFDYVAPHLPNAMAPRDVCIVADVDGEPKDIVGHAVLLAGYAFNNLGWAENRDLALNIFNWMADRKVLVSVPGDRYHAQHVKISLEQLSNIWWLLVVIVPGVFLGLGLLVFWRRSMWK